MKKHLLLICKILSVLLCSAIVGTILLCLSYSIPISRIENNVKNSLNVFEKEGQDFSLWGWCNSRLDNYTDSIMLNIAAYDGDETVLHKALSNYSYPEPKDSGLSKIDGFIDYFSSMEYSYEKQNYARYWHGYIILLKPLLLLFNYSQIRWLNLIIQSFLNFAICVALHKKNRQHLIIPYLLGIGMLMPVATAFSMQYCDVFYIFSISSLIILKNNDKWQNTDSYCLFFAFVGIVTAFFDLLTYPIATIGIPLLFYLILNNGSTRETLKKIVLYIVLWGVGYAGMWSGKWVLASIFTNENIIMDAISSILFRTSSYAYRGDTTSFSLVTMLWVNIYMFIRTPVSLFVLIYAFICAVYIIKHRTFLLEKRNNASNLSVYVCIAFLPILWYLFAKEHSFLHRYFTSKALLVSATSIMFMLRQLIHSMQNIQQQE